MFRKSIPGSVSAIAASLLIAFLLSGCNEQNKPVRGFVLPPGNIQAGKQVFIKYGCFQCHTLSSVTFPEREPNPPITLDIGGKVYRVKNYGELLDAVVNPNHIISPKYRMMLDRNQRQTAESPMPNFNEKLSVAELIDLVAFLHDQYIKMEPPGYQDYGIP